MGTGLTESQREQKVAMRIVLFHVFALCKRLSISTTQIYARVTPKKLFEDMDKYIEATKDLKLVL